MLCLPCSDPDFYEQYPDGAVAFAEIRLGSKQIEQVGVAYERLKKRRAGLIVDSDPDEEEEKKAGPSKRGRRPRSDSSKSASSHGSDSEPEDPASSH